ncbi:hypothetical protein SNE40_018050 [Patella caerulea]|uniref:Uncharacterized protein n=1 Tax=Patella caerulea TaxID=87958 RepID=A0AAN8J7P5_PATCE
MADWSADNNGILNENGDNVHVNDSNSRKYDNFNEISFKNENTENYVFCQNSNNSSMSSKSSRGSEKLKLDGGYLLTEDSETEQTIKTGNKGESLKGFTVPSIPPRKPLVSSWGSKTSLKPPSISLKPVDSVYDSISEDDVVIPSDGCLYSFTVDQMATFFKYMKVEDRMISHMHKKGVNGKRFANLKDTELENLRINNPVIRYFKDRSQRKKAGFML